MSASKSNVESLDRIKFGPCIINGLILSHSIFPITIIIEENNNTINKTNNFILNFTFFVLLYEVIKLKINIHMKYKIIPYINIIYFPQEIPDQIN